MKTKYKISEQDYLQATKLFLKLSKRQLINHIIAGILLLFVAYIGHGVVRHGAIGAILGASIFSMLLRYIFHPIIARRNYRNYPAIKQEFEIELEESGIKISAETGQSNIKWENIIKWREGEKYILIYPMPSLFHIIPKSLEKSGFEISKLKEYLQQQVGNAT